MCYLLFSILTAVDKTAKWVIQRDCVGILLMNDLLVVPQ